MDELMKYAEFLDGLKKIQAICNAGNRKFTPDQIEILSRILYRKYRPSQDEWKEIIDRVTTNAAGGWLPPVENIMKVFREVRDEFSRRALGQKTSCRYCKMTGYVWIELDYPYRHKVIARCGKCKNTSSWLKDLPTWEEYIKRGEATRESFRNIDHERLDDIETSHR